ncbi:MAG: hypothetical protein WBU20_08465, partial [Candidatus Acidiferrum sp.]
LYSVQAITGGSYDLKSAGELQVITDRAKCRGRVIGNKHTNDFRRGRHLHPNQTTGEIMQEIGGERN